MISGLAFGVDMHRIGEPVAGMMAGRDFGNSVFGIAIGPQDAQGWCAPRNVQRVSDFRARAHSLNVLRYLRHLDAGKLFKLAKDRHLGRADLGGRFGIVAMNKSIGNRDRLGIAEPGANALKLKPVAVSIAADMIGNPARQGRFTKWPEIILRIARILQQFANIGEWLVQGTAARPQAG